VILIFVILSSGLALYVHYKGEGFDPIREIQRLKNENRRDDALDMARFFRENQRVRVEGHVRADRAQLPKKWTKLSFQCSTKPTIRFCQIRSK